MCDWPRLDSLLHNVYERQDQSSVAIAARMASLERQIGKLHGRTLASIRRNHES